MKGHLHKRGDMLAGRYEIGKYVDAGGMQEVYMATDKLLDRVVALKAPKNASASKRFRRSAVMSARVNHSCVAKTLDYFETDERAYLVEEFIDGQDLSQVLTHFVAGLDPYLAARILHELGRGVAASHHAEVMHRDLKPSNIMIGGADRFLETKITDFGIAKMAEQEIDEAVEGGDEESITASKTALGALPYMAPESLEGGKAVGKPADIWAVGALMYEVISGGKPFGAGFKAVPAIIAAKAPPLPTAITANPQFVALGKEVHALCLECLRSDPQKRPTADELVRKAERLCYSPAPRELGTISAFKHNAWGFIDASQGSSVFFHRQSVFGAGAPIEGARVQFARHRGGGNDRAFPVIILG